ncbi:MAG TPA: ABC transporter [Firmicutes bacterium]|nr:ABC transporter [Bacillota bacterium]
MSLIVDIERNLPGFRLTVSLKTGSGTLGLLGPSGSGKSMTLRCIAGLERPTAGRISLAGQVLFDAAKGINLPPQRRRIGFLFQHYALFPNLTVSGNIAMGLRGIGRKEQAGIIGEMVALVKLEGLENRYPRQLSGGQQQRAALARALAPRPQVLLLDEPFSALDNHLRGEMEQEVAVLLGNFHGAAVFVSHNTEEVYRLCPDLLVLENGKVTAVGPREGIFSNPPTLAIARMMGCQNLSRIRNKNDGRVEALDWGCCLRLPAATVIAGASHIGIYGNHIRPAGNGDGENILEGRVVNIIEAPHYVTISVKPAKTVDGGCLKIIWPKEMWGKPGPQKQQSLKLQLPPEKIFLIRDLRY